MTGSSRVVPILCSVLLSVLYFGGQSGAQVGKERDKTKLHNIWMLKWPAPWSRNGDPRKFFDDPEVVTLCEAIANQDEPRVKELLASGVDADTRGRKGATPLIWCIPRAESPIFRLLLESGADPNVPVEWRGFDGGPGMRGECVTYLVAQYCGVKTLRTVLEHGGDPGARDVTSGSDCLSKAIGIAGFEPGERVAKVRLLLDKGAEPTHFALCKALRRKKLECALVVLAAGAVMSSPDDFQLLPCHYLSELEDASDLGELDKERVLLLVSKLKKAGAWRPNARVELAEYNRLLAKRDRGSAAFAYMKGLYAASKSKNE